MDTQPLSGPPALRRPRGSLLHYSMARACACPPRCLPSGDRHSQTSHLLSPTTPHLLHKHRLVQNADDCYYGPGVLSRMQLHVFHDGILVATNEEGFTEANTRAICNIACSSKSRRVGAFTGEKGGAGWGHTAPWACGACGSQGSGWLGAVRHCAGRWPVAGRRPANRASPSTMRSVTTGVL
jgi:hypothetical protein